MSFPRMRPYPQQGTITISDGDELPIQIGGSFLRVREADQKFKILLDDDVELIAELNDVFRLNNGDKFKKLTVRNESGFPLTFQLEIGDGSVETNKLTISGGITVISGGLTGSYGTKVIGVAQSEVFAADTASKGYLISNQGSAAIYLGTDENVTTANGFPLLAGATMGWDCRDALHAISSTAGQDLRYMKAEG